MVTETVSIREEGLQPGRSRHVWARKGDFDLVGGGCRWRAWGVKGLIILAALLLVPSMAYFQKHYFAEVLQERLVEEVRVALIAGGVEEPVVSLQWMDATIGGAVVSVEKRNELGEKIEKMDGLRLAPGGNGLLVRGWVELGREKGAWQARGLVPKDFVIGVVDESARLEGWDAELARAAEVEEPAEASGWDRFLGGYFREAGNRKVLLHHGQLTLSGEATREMRKDWLAQAVAVVPKERVREELELRSSVYHFAGHVPEVLRDPVEVARLRKELEALSFEFSKGSVAMDDDALEVVSSAAGVMLEAGGKIRFVVGLGAAAEGDQVAERMEAVVTLLGDYGVGESQLVKAVFDATLDGAKDGQVEFLLR